MRFLTGGQDQAIFLSYRRDDAGAQAGRLYDRLVAEFGPRRVFMDVDVLAPGDNATEKLVGAINESTALLVIIGPSWIQGPEGGPSRLNRPYDRVRVEVETGLARGVRVIPVLVDGASMPNFTDLPASLAPLRGRSPFTLKHETFVVDSDRLINELRVRTISRRPNRRMKGVSAAILLLLIIAFALWIVIATR